jgi:hypothetical protein
MFFYIFLLVLSTASSFCYSKSRDVNVSTFFLITTFLILFTPSALRFGIGEDYFNYVEIFNIISKGLPTRSEIGFYFICKFVSLMGLDVQWLFVIVSFLTILFLFLSIDKKYFFLCIPVYMMLLYCESYNIIRQILASSICLFSTKCFINKKKIKGILMCLLAATFHSSSFIVLFVLLLTLLVNISKSLSYMIYISLFIVFLCFDVMGVFQNITYISYYRYYLTTMNYSETPIKSGIGIILQTVILFTALYYCNENENNNDSEHAVCVLMILCLLIGQLLMNKISVFYRFASVFYFSYMIIFPRIYKSNSKYRSLGLIMISSIICLLFIMNISKDQWAVIPYQSIFH